MGLPSRVAALLVVVCILASASAQYFANSTQEICRPGNDKCRPVTSAELGGIISVFTAVPWFVALIGVGYMALFTG